MKAQGQAGEEGRGLEAAPVGNFGASAGPLPEGVASDESPAPVTAKHDDAPGGDEPVEEKGLDHVVPPVGVEDADEHGRSRGGRDAVCLQLRRGREEVKSKKQGAAGV